MTLPAAPLARPVSPPTPAGPATLSSPPGRVLAAAGLGTAFEWYDFYVYLALAPVIAARFFGGLDTGAAHTLALLAFAAGFLPRPFGALVFGRIGDMMGRKHGFLLTIVVMGLATFAIGMLPDADAIGAAAPLMLVGLRLLQGLAIGGEYGGAVIFVAEHAPAGRRGMATGWIQTTATLGLALALLVVLGTRLALGEAAFEQWGWRLPFVGSIALLALSIWVRLGIAETPVFRRLMGDGAISSGPFREAFGHWRNLRRVLVALLGLTAGQAAVWYACQCYALVFLTESLKVDRHTAAALGAFALLLGAPLFVVFGALSDRIGRKPVVLTGLLLAALSMFPLFGALARAANPALVQAQETAEVQLVVDAADCSAMFDPFGIARSTSGCDIARRLLAERSVRYTLFEAPAGTKAVLRIGQRWIASPPATGAPAVVVHRRGVEFRAAVDAALREVGYPEHADPAALDRPNVIALLLMLTGCAAMVYGPLAALLAEMFPARIRYTSLSLPYHVANGSVGALLPGTAFALVVHGGDMVGGLWVPVAIAGFSFVFGLFFVRETRQAVFERD